MSLSLNNNPVASSTEWDRLWQIVRDVPDDFVSWEQLIRLAEAAEGGISKNSSPENITRLESVYDSFLAKFPLCFGYWKKYADWELAIHGSEGAEKIFERGVTGIHNSIELWNQYIDFKISQTVSNEEIEGLLERATKNVGYDFLAHPFWDKYIEFAENRLNDSKRVLRLLDRIVLIPMHQYARYYEKWRGLRSSLSPTEALDQNTLETFTKEIVEQKGQLGAQELESALKEKMDTQTTNVYKTTQEGTNKRWIFESEIKRSYFHVKPLDRPQLQNWSKYLDFEESQGNVDRIRALYERSLVPCAQYEELWLRYGQWLTKNDLLEEAKHAYERAAFTFVPRNAISAKIALALIYEELNSIEDAKKTYLSLLETEPLHIETILNYIHFERRQNPDAFESLVNTYINSTQLTESAKAFFTIQYTKFLQQRNQIDKAREVYATSSILYSQNKMFWMNYINFELSFYDEGSANRISEVFEKAKKSLPKESQKAISTQYRDYLLERGNSISKLNRNPIVTSTYFTTVEINAVSENSLKRPLAEDNGGYGFSKQARFDNSTQAQSYGGYSQQQHYGGDYYNQQSQQQPWQS